MFNSKKIEELERRIAALEPKQKPENDLPDPYNGVYATSTGTAEVDPLKCLKDRVEKLESEVLPEYNMYSSALMNMIYGGHNAPKGLTLREKVSRICAHLKIEFTREPEKIVIRPVKAKK